MKLSKRYKFVLAVMAVIAILTAVVGYFAVTTLPVQETVEPTVAVVEPTNRDLQEGKPFVFVHDNRQHPVLRTMMLGFFDACEEYDVECKDMSVDGGDQAGIIALFDQAIAQGSSGIVSGLNSPFWPIAIKAVDAGIPVMSMHTPIEPENVPGSLGWVATDIADYGSRAADAMAEQINCEGPVQVTQSTYNDVENLASSSFIEQLQAVCPGIEILEIQEEGFDVPAAVAKAQAILTAHPDITGAFGTTGGSPQTWGLAVQQMGREPGEVCIIGMDYTRPNLDLVRDGWVYAVVGQPIYEETYRVVELFVDHLRGVDVAFDNPYPSPIITVDMVDKYYEIADRVDAMVLE